MPSAVVVTNRDRAIPADRQRGLAMSIPGATLHEVDGGHASCVLGHDRFLPSLMEACQSVSARLDVPRAGLLARGRTLLSRTAN